VAADINGEDNVTFNVKDHAQITFDHSGINRFAVVSRQTIDFVGA
jgi:hypothetical protein